MKKINSIQPIGFPWKTKDPFLMCVYHHDEYPSGNANLGLNSAQLKGRNIGNDFVKKDGYRMYHGSTIPGFPYHPHRGFETVTIGKQGFVDHFDSKGGAGRFGAGDVQWMTAGSGIQHCEMFPLINEKSANPLEIFQIWLNLPAKDKLVAPHFKMLWVDSIPRCEETGDNGKRAFIDVYSGVYKSHKAPLPTPNSWAADDDNEVVILTVKLEANTHWVLPSTSMELLSRSLYFYDGETIKVESEIVNTGHCIDSNPTENLTIINGNKEAYFLLLQGKPINEPVAQHGPFVMNSDAEIRTAFADYRETEFGGWPWPEHEHTNSREKGRFAIYEDGTSEVLQ